MKKPKKLFLGGVAMMAALLFSGTPAHAQTADIITTPGNPVISGQWHVVVTQTDAATNTWRVRVEALEPPVSPSNTGHSISLTFKEADGTTTNKALAVGVGSNTTIGTITGSPSGTYAAGVTSSGTVRWSNDDLDLSTLTAANGGNYFEAYVQLENLDEVVSINASVQNGGDSHVWFGTGVVQVPEPASVAMLLPGLLPLGLVLRRRLSGSDSTEDEKLTA